MLLVKRQMAIPISAAGGSIKGTTLEGPNGTVTSLLKQLKTAEQSHQALPSALCESFLTFPSVEGYRPISHKIRCTCGFFSTAPMVTQGCVALISGELQLVRSWLAVVGYWQTWVDPNRCRIEVPTTEVARDSSSLFFGERSWTFIRTKSRS